MLPARQALAPMYMLGLKGAKMMSLVFIDNLLGWYGVGVGLEQSGLNIRTHDRAHDSIYVFTDIYTTARRIKWPEDIEYYCCTIHNCRQRLVKLQGYWVY